MMRKAEGSRVAVLGGGAWGTALAALYANAGRETVLYARDPAVVTTIETERRNPAYLPDVALPESLRTTASLAEALRDTPIVLVVVPAQTLRLVAQELAGLLATDATAILCAKGIEQATGRFASQVFSEECPHVRVAVLSGPSFAADVAAGLPTAVTIAAHDGALAEEMTRQLSTQTFRGYASDDITGVEAGGALKNVLALAAGMVAGRRLGASAQAAVTTRGFVELRRLGTALGGRPETMMGLSGLGDLILTSAGTKSRNFAYGFTVGEGGDRSQLKLAEGVFSAKIAAQLATEAGVEVPIIEAVAEILDGGLDIDAAMRNLLARPLKREDA